MSLMFRLVLLNVLDPLKNKSAVLRMANETSKRIIIIIIIREKEEEGQQ